MTGKHGKHRTGRKVEYISISCSVCGLVREYRPGEVKGRDIKYCSRVCAGKAQAITGSHVKIECCECGLSFERDRHRVKTKNYCSRGCSAKGLRKEMLLKFHGRSDVDSLWRTSSYIKDYFRKYTIANREKINALSRSWASRNRDKRNELQRIRRGAGGTVTTDEWNGICQKFEFCCVCCLCVKKLTLDHIVPVTKGGRTDVENVQPLCRHCNSAKGAKTVDYRADFKERFSARKS